MLLEGQEPHLNRYCGGRVRRSDLESKPTVGWPLRRKSSQTSTSNANRLSTEMMAMQKGAIIATQIAIRASRGAEELVKVGIADSLQRAVTASTDIRLLGKEGMCLMNWYSMQMKIQLPYTAAEPYTDSILQFTSYPVW